ncbi:hypothetical protein TrRE_jg9289, partial [Triparma retinervis]
ALLAKSTALAAKFKIPMNILFDAEDGEGSMAHCSALLLSPNPRADQLAGPPLQLSEIASSLLSGVQMEKPGLLVARNEENGLVRFFVSEEFEETFGLSVEKRTELYIKNEGNETFGNPVNFAMGADLPSCERFFKVTGSLFAQYSTPSSEPKHASYKLKATNKKGEKLNVDFRIAILLTGKMCTLVFRLVPQDNEEKGLSYFDEIGGEDLTWLDGIDEGDIERDIADLFTT